MGSKLILDKNWGPFGGNIELWEEMITSKDRVTALIGASVLEKRIESLLLRFIIPDGKIIDEIFNPLGPLNSFSSKIKMAYVIGLISKKDYNNLIKIKNIRNQFAHELFNCNFNEDKIQKLIMSLSHPPPEIKESNDPKMIFCRTVHFLEYVIISRIEKLKGVKTPTQYNWK